MSQPHVTMINSNFPIALMLGLRDTFKLTRFIETGTCYGGTTSLAALAFPRVDTVEIMKARYEAAIKKFAKCPNVFCHAGDSRDFVSGFNWKDMPPALIYLDAHWPDGKQSYAPGYELPIQFELDTIKSLYGKHCIVVDDFPLEAVVPMVKGWEYHGYGTKQFAVLTPTACSCNEWLE